MKIDVIELSLAFGSRKRPWFPDFEITMHVGLVNRFFPIIWFWYRRLPKGKR
jgi:hypothetical protein